MLEKSWHILRFEVEMALLEGNGFGTPENMQTRLSYLAESMDILAARFAGYDMVYTPAPNAPGETYFPW